MKSTKGKSTSKEASVTTGLGQNTPKNPAAKNRISSKFRQLVGNPSVNQKIEQIEKRLTDAVLLSFEKAVAHREHPSKYPLPTDSRAVERAFHNMLEALPRGRRDKVIDQINTTLKSKASERRATYQDLVDVDFESRTSIAEQALAMAAPAGMKFTQSEADEILALHNKIIEQPSRTAGFKTPKKKQPQIANFASRISFFVDSLTCLKTDDVRKDEISLAGFATDAVGNVVERASFFVGKFREGDTVSLNQNSKLFTLDVSNDPATSAVPQTFIAGLFIIESDLIDNKKLLDKLELLFFSIWAALGLGVTTLTALLLLGVSGIGFGIFAAMLIGTAIFKALQTVLFYAAPDFSITVTDTLTFVGQIAVGTTFDRTMQIDKSALNFRDDFDGNYSLAARWVAEL